MKKLKNALALLLAFGMIFALAACGGQEPPATDGGASVAPAGSTDAPDGGDDGGSGLSNVTLEVYLVQTDWADSWDEMESRFEDAYPEIDVVSVGVGEYASDFIPARATANDLPGLVQLDNNDLYRSLADEGKIVDLTGNPVTQNIPASYLEAFTYDGTLMGITQGAAFAVLYLNMDILNEAGWDAPPTNWDEFIQCCKDIQDTTGIAPLTLAGDKTTTCWMLYESILANVCGDELGFGVYEEQFKDGTFDFAAYTRATEMLAEVSPYLMTGTASMGEDDVTTAFADGSVAMAVAGNWTANNICDAIAESTGDPASAVAVLAPFNEAGKDAWISVSPETAFAMTVQDDPDVQKAAEIFFGWVFEAENFAIIQNARGTVPVLSTMTEDQIVLPDAISAVVEPMNQAQYVLMGFNLWTQEFCDSACTSLKDVYSGNMSAADAVAGMSELLPKSNVNG